MAKDLDLPVRIAVLGNFRGNFQSASNRSTTALHPIQIDRDNFEQVMLSLDIRLDGIKSDPNSDPFSLQITSMEDFQPDRLFEVLKILEPLRHVRERLHDPTTVDDAVLDLLRLGVKSQHPSSAPSQVPVVKDVSQESSFTDANLLEQMLEPNASAGSAQPPQRNEASDWQQIIESIAAPYAVAGADPRKAELLEVVDARLQGIMSTVLHHQDFRALEAAWRALHLLVHRLETSSQLSVYLIDVSKAELISDLVGSADLSKSTLYRTLVEEPAEETIAASPEVRWSLLVGDYAFGSGDEDANLLRQLAKLAAVAEAPLVTGVDFRQLQSVRGEQWQLLRHATEAAYLGLIWPRFLLRLPYGADTKPIESFRYEEVLEGPSPPQLLWGNSAYLAALLLGQAFADNTPGAPLHAHCQVDRLPVWMFKRDDVVQLHPCGERLVTGSMAEQLLTLGITPLLSVRDRDVAQIPQMISLSGGKLRGRWLD